MKTLATLVGLFVLAPVFACPNLAGNYTCEDDDGSTYRSMIQQRNMGSVTVYEVTDDEGTEVIRTDGVSHQVDLGDGMMGTIKSWCEGNNVRMLIEASMMGQTFNADSTVSLQGGQLVAKTVTHFQGQSQEQTEVCFRD